MAVFHSIEESLADYKISLDEFVSSVTSAMAPEADEEEAPEVPPPHDFSSDHELKEAVNLWCADKPAALAMYGPIELWGTGRITSMKHLFANKFEFNE